tara:strand:+ start:1166 stop:2206 length:1041 start_codon:yes stop_codon:yes gene_type:complete
MLNLKIANWNIEWMNRWFTSDSAGPAELKASSDIGGVTDIQALAARVAAVITDLDADVIAVQEGPSRRSEMALFVSTFLNDAYEVIGPAGSGQQKLYVLVKRGSTTIASAEAVENDIGIDFDAPWDVDVNADATLEPYNFTRPPQLVRLLTTTGASIRLINLHLKSKYVHLGASMWNDPNRRQEFIVEALEARRRISAESMRVRAYLDHCFDDDGEAKLVVVGDLNDGPGSDFFERFYLTHNVAGMIAGSPFQPRRMLRHAFIDTMAKELNYTAVFDDFIDEIDDRKILLDHIFVSASLYWEGDDVTAEGKIEHAVFESHIDVNADVDSRQRLPSDHRPQSVTIHI